MKYWGIKCPQYNDNDGHETSDDGKTRDEDVDETLEGDSLWFCQLEVYHTRKDVSQQAGSDGTWKQQVDINSLAPGRSESDSKNVIFNLVLLIGTGIFKSFHDNILQWMPQDLYWW